MSETKSRQYAALHAFDNTKLVGKKITPLDEDDDSRSKLTPSSLDVAKTPARHDSDSDVSLPSENSSMFTDAELMHTKTPLLNGDDPHSKREELRQYFHMTFSLYERLFDVLKEDATYYQQPEKLRHPLIFYFGHTAVFFINKLRLAGLLHTRINEQMESTLAIGVG